MNNLSGMNRGSQKKLAMINDFCGFGRCSLTVSMPIVSAMGVQACPVPTAVFSNHTAYESFYKHDMTPSLDSYLNFVRLSRLTGTDRHNVEVFA